MLSFGVWPLVEILDKKSQEFPFAFQSWIENAIGAYFANRLLCGIYDNFSPDCKDTSLVRSLGGPHSGPAFRRSVL